MLQGEAGLLVPFTLIWWVIMEALSVTHKRLGQSIKVLRKERRMTQEDLAFKVNVDRSYMGFVERGEKNPTLKILVKISKALDVSLSELFHGI